MQNVLLCVVIVLLIVWLLAPSLLGLGECRGDFERPNLGYAAPAPNKPRGGDGDGNDYNDFLQNAALDPSIKEQHKEWLDNLQINLQPRQYSIRDDASGPNSRVGLLLTDYNNIINSDQNISLPSARVDDETDGGNSRFGGYGISLCPVQRP